MKLCKLAGTNSPNWLMMSECSPACESVGGRGRVHVDAPLIAAADPLRRLAGHMQIAYVAYKKLDAPVKDKVDALLKLNKDYAKWTANAPDERTAKLNAFVHAATWADDIKTKDYNYTRDKVDGPTAGQNIGYADHN